MHTSIRNVAYFIAILFFQIITAYLHMVVQLKNLVSDQL